LHQLGEDGKSYFHFSVKIFPTPPISLIPQGRAGARQAGAGPPRPI